MMDLHSKYIMGRALLNRQGDYLVSKIDEMIKTLPQNFQDKIRVIQSDKEFDSYDMKNMVNQIGNNNVKLVHGQSHTPTQQAQIERAVQTISRKLFLWAKETGQNNWETVLQDIINNYNLTIHSSTGFMPEEALFNTNPGTRNAVNTERAKVATKTMAKETRKFRELKVGDPVRITLVKDDPAVRALEKSKRRKGYSIKGNYTEEVFTVKTVKNKNRFALHPTYELDNKPGEIYKREDLLYFNPLYPDI